MPNAFDDLPPTSPELQILQQATPEGRPNAFADLAPAEWKSSRVKQGNPYAIPKDSPLYGESEGQMTLEGVGRGMVNVARHVGNLVSMTDMGATPQERFMMGAGGQSPPGASHPLVSDQDLANAKELDEPLMSQPAGRFGSTIGETAVLTPAVLGGEGALGATGLGARVLASAPARGMAEGAGQGALMSDPGERGAGALTGAATGLAIPAAMTSGQRLAYGLQRTPEAQQLIDQGVRLTPGQMNPEGIWNKIEENIRGVPVVGNVVEHARTQAQQDFQRGVIEEAAAPGHSLQSTSKDPNVLFQEAQDSYKPLYKAAEGFPVQPMIPSQNQTLAYAMRQAANNKAVGAGADVRQNAQDFLDGQLQAQAEKANATGGWKSEHLIQLRSAINEEIRGAGQDQAGKKYAQLLTNARNQVTNSINSQIPPDAATALKTANDAYPKLAIIRDAIKRGGDQATGFTPAQLSSSVKEASDTNQYARGGGLMRDWSSAGRDIFTERNPRTGASHGTTGTLAGAAYALHHFVPGAQIPAAVGTAGALGMIGTQTGRDILAGQTVPQQATQRLIEGLRQSMSPGQREIAGAVSRTAVNRAATLNPKIEAYLSQMSPSASGTGSQ